MQFSFYIEAKSPVELNKKIVQLLDFWWPKTNWLSNVITIEECLTDDEKPKSVIFHVIAEVNKQEVENQVRLYG